MLIHPGLDLFFTFVTDPKSWIPVWIVLALFLLIKGKRKGRVTFFLIILAFGVTDFTAARFIKPGAGRIRPSRLLREYMPLKEDMEILRFEVEMRKNPSAALEDSLQHLSTRVYHLEDSLALSPEKIRALKNIRRLDGYGGRWSFPSNHAANFAAIASVLTFFYRKRRYIPWIIVVLVAYSRVYVGRHYPMDVVAGILYGFLIGRFFCSLWQGWLYKKMLIKQKSAIKAPLKESETSD